MDLTIGMLKTRNRKNGSPITNINSKDDLEKVRALAAGKKKEDLPVLTAYRGVRGEYKPSNIFFVDIDTKEGVDKIIANPEKLFDNFRNIYFIQKSYSGKLHICGIFAEEIETAEEWSYMTRIYTAATLYAIKNIYGIDYSKIDGGIDDHSFKYSQLLYVSAEDIFFNSKLTPIYFPEENKTQLFVEYPIFKPTKKEVKVYQAGDLQSKYECGDSTNRICIDRNFKIGELSGNDVRWRISKIATEIFGKDAKKWCDERFYYGHGTSIFSNTRKDIGINHLVLNWLVANKYLSIKEIYEKPQTVSNYVEVFMENPYLSSYVDTICDYIQKENVLTVYAPTGAGKTTCISGYVKNENDRSIKICKGIVDSYPNSIVLVPFNVTNNLYDSMNIVSSENNNKYKPGKPNVMIWDQFNKISSSINPEIVIVDESHTLFLDRSYRNSAVATINTLYTYLQKGIKVVFVSATPAGEVKIFNSFVLRFKKKDERDVKITFCTVNDTFTSILKDIEKGGFDKICVFSDYDAGMLYANCLNRGMNDITIYHSDFKKNVDQLRRDEKINNRISLLTCIAFNGLNIKNEGEKILIDIRMTQGETTYNEIIQIIGRFRNNKDITVRLYADGKYSKAVDLDELFHDAKVIVDSGSIEVSSEYWERMNNENVQDAFKQIDSFRKSQDIVSIIGLLKNDYPINVVNNVIKKGDIIAREDPYKREASNIFFRIRNGEEIEVTDPMILGYINEWNKKIEEMSVIYPGAGELVDNFLGRGKKITKMYVSTAIDKTEQIIRINCISDEEWDAEVAKRSSILKGVKNEKLRKNLNATFKSNNKYRNDYKGLIELGVLQYEVEDVDFEALKKSRSEGGKKGDKIKKIEAAKKGKRIIYNGVEYSTCKECAAAIGKSVDTITRWLKEGKITTV